MEEIPYCRLKGSLDLSKLEIFRVLNFSLLLCFLCARRACNLALSCNFFSSNLWESLLTTGGKLWAIKWTGKSCDFIVFIFSVIYRGNSEDKWCLQLRSFKHVVFHLGFVDAHPFVLHLICDEVAHMASFVYRLLKKSLLFFFFFLSLLQTLGHSAT